MRQVLVFKIRVLEASQETLAQYTDIKFDWEVAVRRGRGGKITSIRFKIEKNDNYVKQLSLEDYLTGQKHTRYEGATEEFERPGKLKKTPFDEKMEFLAEACGNEFSTKEILVLHDLMVELLPHDVVRDPAKCYDYLTIKYRYMNMRDEKKPIKHRFSYMKSIIGNDLQNV